MSEQNTGALPSMQNDRESVADVLHTPTETQSRIVYLLQCDNAAMAEALRQCRDQFAFYAREHYAAGKSDKGDTNTRFADIANKALTNVKPLARTEHKS